MARNPRDPKAVKKLIADAQQRQIDNAVIAWLKKVLAADRDGRGGGGTRKHRR